MTDSRFEVIDIQKLNPFKKNSRKHSSQQIKKIEESIKTYGFTKPILVWKNNQIVAGHGAWEAAKSLGIETVPIYRVDHLDETQMRAYVIADNRLGEMSTWDQELLLEELTDLADLEFKIELTGFDLDFLADGILDANPSPKENEGNDYENEDHEIIGEPDYSLIEGSDDQVLDDMRSETRKAIQIEFEIDRYEEAQALVKYWRTAGGNVGLMLIEKLIEEKAKHETVEGRDQGTEVLPS